MKEEVWRLSMIGKFSHCQSCDEDCGYVYFTNIKFNISTGEPCGINYRKKKDGKYELVLEEGSTWSPRNGARQNAQLRAKEFKKASQGPLYKLEDFVKGGAWENNILKSNEKHNALMDRIGMPSCKDAVPEVIFIPKMHRDFK